MPRTRQASPAPVQQRRGRAGELRVRQAQARPCARPRASAVHARRTRPADRSEPFCGGGGIRPKWPCTVSEITREPRRRRLPAAGPSSYYVRRCENAPGAAAGRAGAAVAVSKPIFPPFSARDHFESSPRVEIAVLASSARPRQSRKYTTSKGKKKSAPAASGGARNDKMGKTDMVQFLFFGPVNILARATVAH